MFSGSGNGVKGTMATVKEDKISLLLSENSEASQDVLIEKR